MASPVCKKKHPMNSLLITDLGMIAYSEASALQQRIAQARKAGGIEDVLLLCEHPPVITLGRNGNRENLLASENVLRQKSVDLYETNRGGDITFHGPGQIVGYPILNLDRIRRDVHWYVRTLEEVMIRASADFAISAFRIEGKTGIWVHTEKSEEKLAAIGVHISRWVTTHGFAYNVATDLRNFELIVPCGIADRKATSLEKLLSRGVTVAEVQPHLAKHFCELFASNPRWMARQELQKLLVEAEASVSIPS